MLNSSLNEEIVTLASKDPSVEVVQHSLLKSVLLHLSPGIPILLFYIIFAPIFIDLGFPQAFALCLAIPLVLIPTQLGFLLYAGKRVNGILTLKNIVLYRKPVKIWQFIIYGLLIVVWSSLCFMILSKSLGGYIAEKFFSWTPEWFLSVNSFEGSKVILLTTWIMIMVFGNILGPAVEELYFRGYLLPRISRLKGWAPILNAILFSAYHFWSPWEVITRAIAVLPVSYIAYKKQNIYIGMIAHLLLNTLSSLSLLSIIFK